MALTTEILSTIQSDDYKRFTEILLHRAMTWVPRIRRQYAIKAYEMYQNPTVRKLVFAYGEEVDNLQKDLLREFRSLSEAKPTGQDPEELDFYRMEGSCLNHAGAYAQAIDLLFEIDFKG